MTEYTYIPIELLNMEEELQIELDRIISQTIDELWDKIILGQ